MASRVSVYIDTRRDPLLEFEILDTGGIHVKKDATDEERDRLYVLRRSGREGRNWPFA